VGKGRRLKGGKGLKVVGKGRRVNNINNNFMT
jgi:hypothetical protein